jgi:hypothetical protein
MSKVIASILVGLCFIFLGALVRSDPSPSLHGFPVPKQTGTFFIIVGIFYIVYFLLNAKRIIADSKNAKKLEKIVMCPNCRKPVFAKDIPDGKCHKCQIEVENVEGFYDRHPELRNHNNKA